MLEEHGLWRGAVALDVRSYSTLYTHSSPTGDHLGLDPTVKYLEIVIHRNVRVVSTEQPSVTQQPSNIEILDIYSESDVQTLSQETFNTVHPNLKYLGITTQYITAADMECLTQNTKHLQCLILSVMEAQNMSKEKLKLLVDRIPVVCVIHRQTGVDDEILAMLADGSVGEDKQHRHMMAGKQSLMSEERDVARKLLVREVVWEMYDAVEIVLDRVYYAKYKLHWSDDGCLSLIVSGLSSDKSAAMKQLSQHRYSCHVWCPQELGTSHTHTCSCTLL